MSDNNTSTVVPEQPAHDPSSEQTVPEAAHAPTAAPDLPPDSEASTAEPAVARVYAVNEPGSTSRPIAAAAPVTVEPVKPIVQAVATPPPGGVAGSESQPQAPGWRAIVRWTMGAFALFAVAAILWLSAAALTPFIIGLVLAYLMVPMVNRLDQRVPRWAAILIVYTFTFGLLGIGLGIIIPAAVTQIDQVIDSIPEWYNNGRIVAEQLFNRFQREAPLEVRQRVQEQIQQLQLTIEENATAWATSVAAFLFNSVRRTFATLTFLLGFLIIPFFLFYILLDTNRLPGAINRMLHPRIRADFWNVTRIIDTIFGQYIRGQLILGLTVGIMSFVGLQALNWFTPYEVRFTLLLAIVAGFGELIPVVGPILSAIPAIIVGSTDGLRTALAVTALYIVIQQVENQVLVPRIVGNTLKLHAALLMALLVIASQIGGLLLVILIAPLTAIARDIFVYFHQRLQEPPVPPEVAIGPVLAHDQDQ